MGKTDDALLAKLNKLSPAQREALLKKIKQQKSGKAKKPQAFTQLPIDAIDRSVELFPLSFAQQRLWFLEQLNKGSSAYNIAAAIKLSGELDSDILDQTFQRIIQRHESLRTLFVDTEEGAKQKVLSQLDWSLKTEDASNINNDAELQRMIDNEADQGFDIENGPLFRAKLLKLSDSEHILTIVMHHIISDAWSSQILMGEVSRIYSMLKSGAAVAIPSPKIQYVDYAAWQRQCLEKDDAQAQIDYWKDKLDGYANLNLATDRPRPSLLSYRGDFHRIQLRKDLVTQLQKFCLQQKTTVFNGLLSAFQCLLYRYTQQTNFCIGTPVAGRDHLDIQPLIGFFVNSLALRSDISSDDNFTSLINKVKTSSLEAQRYQDIPFEQLVDILTTSRDGSYSPIFQVFFSYNPGLIEQQLSLPGLQAQYIPADTKTAKFDISLVISDTMDGLSCHFEYNSDLFNADTIVRLAEHFERLLTALCTQPETEIHKLPMLSKKELSDAISHDTSIEFPRFDIASLFEQQVEKSPGKLAVKQGDDALRYDELNRKANQLAHYLISQGVQQGDYIGLCFPPSIELTQALLAIIKIGAAYVPMDPNYPAERLNYMVENADIAFILTAQRIDTQLIQVDHILDIDMLDLSSYSDSNLDHFIAPDSDLYVIYTSGSTGLPKAAVVSHQGEANLLHWYSNNYQLQADDKFLVFSAIGFDLTQKNLFAPLCYGAELHFNNTEWYDPESLLNCIEASSISWINCAPSAFYPIIDHCKDFSQLRSLSKLFFGGEHIRLANFNQWFDSGYFSADITNMYGPTECTDIATSHTLDNPVKHKGPIAIGKASSNVELYVLDQHKNLLPKGTIGELYIGGKGVGKGYLNNTELTEQRFIDNPFKPNKTIYKTGDLVRVKQDDSLEFIARTDDQIKIRGFRIELGEIETTLRNMFGIVDAVVTVREINGQSQLLAFLCSTETIQDNHFYKKHLRQSLPDFMVPIAYFQIDEVPLSPNGKVDRNSLPDVDLSALIQNTYVAPRTAIEMQLCEIWQELLQQKRVGIQDNFFELGGHSLLATQLLTQVRGHYEIDLPLRTLFEVNTIEGLAEIISALLTPANDIADDEDFEEGIL